MNHTEHEKSIVDPHQSRSVEYDRAKLEITQPNSQFDQELLLDGITHAGTYFESGVRDFGDYAAAMIDDLGTSIMPYLLSFWEGIRDYPGLDTQDMTDVYSSRKLYEQLLLVHSDRSNILATRQGLSLQMVANKRAPKIREQGSDSQ